MKKPATKALRCAIYIRMHRRSRSWKALPRPPLRREACILTDCSRIAVRPGARRNNRTVLDLNYAR